MNKDKPRVAIYCRLSQEDRNKRSRENDSESIKNQKIMLKEYAEDQDWEIQGIYSDDDFTGTDRNRPAFNEVIRLAEAKEIDIVLCKSQSRFARELEIVEKYINGKFFEWGTRFKTITDNIDINAPLEDTIMLRQMNGIMDESYLRNNSISIKSALRTKRTRGEFTGSFALYGYKKDPNNKNHLIIDPIAAEVVKEIFNLYNKGYGKTAIARELNNKGIPNPTQYKVEQGIMYKTPPNKIGTLWKYSSIDDILHNEMYIGTMVQGKYGSVSYKTKKNKPKPKDEWVKVPNTHEPIIDIELWNSVQAKINDNFKPFSNGQIGLFAHKCKCMHCGYTLKSSKCHNDRYLRCPTRYVDKNCCKGSFISENVVKKVVLKELNLLIEQYLNVDKLEEETILNKWQNKREKIKVEIAKYQAELNKYSKALKDLFMQKVNEIITQDEFTTLSVELRKDNNKIEELLDEKKKQLLELENEQDILKTKRELLQKYVNVTELTREMIDNLIDYIEISSKDPVTKKKTVKIYWKI